MNPRSAHPAVPRVILTVFALTALLDLLSLAVGYDPGHTVTKPLLMPLLAAYAALRGAPRLLVAALLCGWGGDTLLLSDADPAFLAGMSFFAAGHLNYLALFRTYGGLNSAPRARAVLLALGYAAALAVTVTLLWPDLPADLRVPVAGYSTLLTAMACAAATRLGLVAGLGGALFMVSDTFIATGVADWPQPPRPDFWIMLTYVAAQFLLVRGVLGTLAERRAPAAAYREVRSTTP
ncbi:lysoplasmalogenase [Streptomyces sp. N50]|uniref:lysoplasmalogenase n=1 Tax=Streptomyces sp. N50 TaxID=3081765 RepID=UPI0029622F7B|nr:lysoplasmalogenase [Streptomyces sp. N50]WOX08707.1 lysoplasmalogenase [Streptomyces sp. N50]